MKKRKRYDNTTVTGKSFFRTGRDRFLRRLHFCFIHIYIRISFFLSGFTTRHVDQPVLLWTQTSSGRGRQRRRLVCVLVGRRCERAEPINGPRAGRPGLVPRGDTAADGPATGGERPAWPGRAPERFGPVGGRRGRRGRACRRGD